MGGTRAARRRGGRAARRRGGRASDRGPGEGVMGRTGEPEGECQLPVKVLPCRNYSIHYFGNDQDRQVPGCSTVAGGQSDVLFRALRLSEKLCAVKNLDIWGAKTHTSVANRPRGCESRGTTPFFPFFKNSQLAGIIYSEFYRRHRQEVSSPKHPDIPARTHPLFDAAAGRRRRRHQGIIKKTCSKMQCDEGRRRGRL